MFYFYYDVLLTDNCISISCAVFRTNSRNVRLNMTLLFVPLFLYYIFYYLYIYYIALWHVLFRLYSQCWHLIYYQMTSSVHTYKHYPVNTGKKVQDCSSYIVGTHLHRSVSCSSGHSHPL